jgi:hypothetical protein
MMNDTKKRFANTVYKKLLCLLLFLCFILINLLYLLLESLCLFNRKISYTTTLACITENMKIDIINRIKSDFEKDSNKALEILENRLKELEYLDNDRIIRCIIYL